MMRDDHHIDRTQRVAPQQVALGGHFNITGQQQLVPAGRDQQHARCIVATQARCRRRMQQAKAHAVRLPAVAGAARLTRRGRGPQRLTHQHLLDPHLCIDQRNPATVVIIGMRDDQLIDTFDTARPQKGDDNALGHAAAAAKRSAGVVRNGRVRRLHDDRQPLPDIQNMCINAVGRWPPG